MPVIDVIASERHFAEHLQPVWEALPAEVKGAFYVPLEMQSAIPGAAPLPAQHVLTAQLRSRESLAVVASWGDLKRARRGGSPVVFCEHGAGQTYSGRHASYAGGPGREDVCLFLCPNGMVAARNKMAYPYVPALVTGSPKLDRWCKQPPKPRGDPPVVAVSFHWECVVCPETRSSWSHFRNALPGLAQRYKVLGHGHPRIMDTLAPAYAEMGIEVVPEFNAILERADVYCIDNSSTLFEFASLDRPVVVLNAPWYRRNIHHGMRFWEFADIGVQASEPHELLAAVEKALVDLPEQKARREAVIERVYPVRGEAAEAAATAIVWALRNQFEITTAEPELSELDRRLAEKAGRYAWARSIRRIMAQGSQRIVRVRMRTRTYWRGQRLIPGQIVRLPADIAKSWCRRPKPIAEYFSQEVRA